MDILCMAVQIVNLRLSYGNVDNVISFLSFSS